jgi:hypothetical protein
MDLNKFSRDELILAGAALLLAIDLLFLPWFSYSSSFTVLGHSVGGSYSLTGTDAPDGWLGVIGVLAALALVADLAVERLGNAQLPSIGGSRGTTRLALAGLAVVCVALKFLFNIHFSLFGFGFWAAAVLAIAMVVATLRIHETEAAAPPPVATPPAV